MISAIHQAVKDLAGEKGALVLPEETLGKLLLNGVDAALSRLQAISVPLDGFPELSVRLTAPLPIVLTATLAAGARKESGFAESITAQIGGPIAVNLDIHLTNDEASILSTLELQVDQLIAAVFISDPLITFGSFDFNIQSNLSPAPGREVAIEHAGLQVNDVMSAEGGLRLSSRRFVSSLLGEGLVVNVRNLMKNFEISGDWQSDVRERALIIVPQDELCPIEPTSCPDIDRAPNLRVVSHPNGNGGIDLEISGLPEVSQPQQVPDEESYASVYLSKPLLEKRFGNVKPGIVFHDRSRKFIGYELVGTIALSYVVGSLSLNPNRLGIEARFDLDITGFASLNIAVPCVGRMDLATAHFEQQRDTVVRIFVGFEVDTESRLRFMSGIEEPLQVSPIDASVSGFSRYTSMAGGTAAIVGFVTDVILGRVLAHNVPIQVRRAIRDDVNSKSSVLIDASEIISMIPRGAFNRRTISIDDTSLLVGLTYSG